MDRLSINDIHAKTEMFQNRHMLPTTSLTTGVWTIFTSTPCSLNMAVKIKKSFSRYLRKIIRKH